jgi:hypothetical protein
LFENKMAKTFIIYPNNELAIIIKIIETNLSYQFIGTISPYPTVITVVTEKYNESI